MTAEPNVPTSEPAGEALVQQIAEAQYERDVAVDEARRQRKECALWKEASNTERKRAEAAEAQVAPLRDERARLIEAHQKQARFATQNYERWQAEGARLAAATDRAIAAESALRQVRELADEWERSELLTGTMRRIAGELRAVLDSARVGAADAQPEVPCLCGGNGRTCDCSSVLP